MSPSFLFVAGRYWFFAVCSCVFRLVLGFDRKLLIFGTFSLIFFGQWVIFICSRIGFNKLGNCCYDISVWGSCWLQVHRSLAPGFLFLCRPLITKLGFRTFPVLSLVWSLILWCCFSSMLMSYARKDLLFGMFCMLLYGWGLLKNPMFCGWKYVFFWVHWGCVNTDIVYKNPGTRILVLGSLLCLGNYSEISGYIRVYDLIMAAFSVYFVLSLRFYLDFLFRGLIIGSGFGLCYRVVSLPSPVSAVWSYCWLVKAHFGSPKSVFQVSISAPAPSFTQAAGSTKVRLCLVWEYVCSSGFVSQLLVPPYLVRDYLIQLRFWAAQIRWGVGMCSNRPSYVLLSKPIEIVFIMTDGPVFVNRKSSLWCISFGAQMSSLVRLPSSAHIQVRDTRDEGSKFLGINSIDFVVGLVFVIGLEKDIIPTTIVILVGIVWFSFLMVPEACFGCPSG